VKDNSHNSRDRSYTKDRNDRRYSNSNDFSSRNSYKQRRFSYLILVTYKDIIQLNNLSSIVEVKESTLQENLNLLFNLVYYMKQVYHNIFFDLNKLQPPANQNDNAYDLIYNHYQGNNNGLALIECRMMSNTSPPSESTNITSMEKGNTDPNLQLVDVHDSNTPSTITSGAQGEVHMFGVTHKRNLMTQNDL
jgi:hypothetical protein